MQVVQAPRASSILYSLLSGQDSAWPWLLPANICPIVPITFFKAGVPFEFVDISAKTLHLDLEQTAERVERGRYGGVLYAHTYGELSTPNEFFRHLKSSRPELVVVDDRCLCPPDLEPDEETIADAVLYSTGYAKVVELNLGGYGFLKESTRYQPRRLAFDPDDHDRIEKRYKQAVRSGTRYVYDDCDWLRTEAELPAWRDYRKQISDGLEASQRMTVELNRIYAGRLPAEIQLPPEYQLWRFSVRVKSRERVLKAIFAAGLFASAHYASLAGIMGPGECPQAEMLAGTVINLFNDYHFDVRRAEQVCAVVRDNLD